MERGIGWSLIRWAGALGTGLLVVTLFVASYRIAAVGADQTAVSPEKQKESASKTAAAAKTKREALRYGGKSFDQWRIELETELKPEIRVDGLTAMAAFGANGYGAEAARIIVDLMGGYSLYPNNDKDKRVVEAAIEAIQKIDKPAFPVLWNGLRSDNERSRQFAAACFQRLGTNWHPPVPDLLQVVKEADPQTREVALSLLRNVKDKPKSCIPLLIECLKDEELEGVRVEAMQNLFMIGPDAKDALPQLRRLRDKTSSTNLAGDPLRGRNTYIDLVLRTIEQIGGK